MNKLNGSGNFQLPQKYFFYPFTMLDATGDKSYFSTSYLGTQYLKNSLTVRLKDNNNQLVKVLGEPGITQKQIHYEYKYKNQFLHDIMKNLISIAKEDTATVLLGFSVFGWSDTNKYVSSVIRRYKQEYPNIVLIGGGPMLVDPLDIQFGESLFDSGFDILNYGASNDFVDFISNLDSNDVFYYENGVFKLRSSKQVPGSVYFYSDLGTRNEVDVHLKETFTYDQVFHKIQLYLNSGCNHRCKFCSIPHFMFNHLPKESKILDYVNRYIKKLKHPRKLRINLSNPNPMQNLENFKNIIYKLEYKDFEMNLFGDFAGLGNKKTLTKTINLFKQLLSKYPKLSFHVMYSMDIIQYENEADFIGKAIGKRTLNQKQITNSINNFMILCEELDVYKEQFTVGISQIFSPSNDLEVIAKKFDTIIRMSKKGIKTSIFFLYPERNSQLFKEHVGNFIPGNLCNYRGIERFSLRGHFYKNSRYMDMICLFETVIGGVEPLFIEMQKFNINPNYKVDKTDFDSHWSNILFKADKKGELVDCIYFVALNYFYNRYRLNRIDKESYLKGLYSIDNYANFMIDREVYIGSINSEYQRNSKYKKLLITLRIVSSLTSKIIYNLENDLEIKNLQISNTEKNQILKQVNSLMKNLKI